MKIFIPVYEVCDDNEKTIYYENLGTFKDYRSASEALLKKELDVWCDECPFSNDLDLHFGYDDEENKEYCSGYIEKHDLK